MFPGLLLIAPASFGLELKHPISCKFADFSVRIFGKKQHMTQHQVVDQKMNSCSAEN